MNSFTIVLRYGQNILSVGVIMSKVKELRIKAALNISELNRLSGVSRPTIEKIEKDEPVRADLASAICRVLSDKLGYEVTIESAEIKVL
jgi:DNA-binding XRE family transcriptional regulator